MDVGRPGALSECLAALLSSGCRLEEVLPFFTSNVARTLRLPQKGTIQVGADADLVTLDEHHRVRDVMLGGVWQRDE